jgi:hypothetical protein
MRSLLLCRDGILRMRDAIHNRAEDKFYPVFLPVADMEERRPGLFLSLLRSSLEMEEGLDVREALLNLAPFSEQVSHLAHIDFERYLAEAEKPLAEDHFADLDTLAFTFHQSISAIPEFERDEDGEILSFERIPGSRFYRLKDSTPVITDRVSISEHWHCGGYKTGTTDFFDNRENGYGMNLSPLNKWHHLKLKMVDHYWLYDETFDSDYLTHKNGLFSHTNPLVENHTSDTGRIYSRRIKVQAPDPTLNDIILGCLIWEIGFHGNPDDVAAFADELKESVEECELDRELRSSFLDDDGEVDPAKLAEIDAQIEAELAEKKAREEAEYRANPYEEKDLRLLELVQSLNSRNPALVKAPNGLPE